MKLQTIISSAISLLKVKYLGQRIPVAVRFQLTNRCDHKCLYCTLWKTKAQELSTQQVLDLLAQMKKAGTEKVSFSGGEPLLRDDIGQIINYCRKIGISPEMNSRGAFIDKKIKDIKGLDLLKVSLNGNEEIHDIVSDRKGAYLQAIHAIELAKQNGIRVSIASTLTKQNIAHLDSIIKLAEKYDTFVAFQPLKTIYRGIEDVDKISPDTNEYKAAIDKLIVQKKSGNKRIRNSVIGLEHIYNWPKYPELLCAAGRLFCIVETNGDVYPCDRVSYKTESVPNAVKMGFKAALNNLPQTHCAGCGFCGSLELSFLLNFNFSTIGAVWRVAGER